MNILEEADKLTSGGRRDSYGHPKEDYAKTALIWTGILHDKLKPGVHISPEEAQLCMIGVKLSREANKHKRDNLVDIAGYARTLEMTCESDDDSMEALERRGGLKD